MVRRFAPWGLAILLALTLAACSAGRQPPSPPSDEGVTTTPANPPLEGQQATPIPFFVEQADGMGWLVFRALGELKSPKVEYRLGDKVLGSKELQPDPQGGGFVGAAPRPQERSEEIKIVLLSDGEVVSQVEMRYNTGVMQHWSANFFVDPPYRLDSQTLLLKGKARVTEGVFVAEVRKDGEVLARQTVQTSEGAPAFGDFEARVKVPEGIPEGVKVWFIVPSPKDGTEIVELVVPAVYGK